MKTIEKYFQLFLFTLAFSMLSQIINYYSLGELYLPWPGRQILPSILYEQHKLLNDFYTLSSVGTQYQITAKILNVLVFFSDDKFLAFYSVMSIIYSATIYFISSILILKFIKTANLLTNKNIEKNHFNILFLASFLLSGLNLIPFFRKLKFLFLGIDVAGFTFPLSDQINPGGLSFGLIESIALVYLSGWCFFNIKNRIIYFLLFIFSIIVHPIVPIFLLIVNLVVLLLDSNNKLYKERILDLSICSILYVSVLIVLKLVFEKNDLINKEDFYNIYVRIRHPHHYLPTFYFNFLLISFLTINCIIITAIYFMAKNKNLKKLIILTIIYPVLIHLIQYVGVELLKIKYLTIIGISRLAGGFNFLYIVILLSFLFERFYTFKSLKIFKSFNNAIYINLISSVLAIIFFVYHYNFTLNKINQNVSRKLELILKSNGLNHNSEIIVDIPIENDFLLLREIGHLDVFQDEYFPFSTNKLVQWNSRRLLKTSLFKSGFNNLVNLNQLRDSIGEKSIIVVSTNNLGSLKLISKIVLRNNKYANIYLVPSN